MFPEDGEHAVEAEIGGVGTVGGGVVVVAEKVFRVYEMEVGVGFHPAADDLPCGLLLLTFKFVFVDGEVTCLATLGVQENYRRRGMGCPEDVQEGVEAGADGGGVRIGEGVYYEGVGICSGEVFGVWALQTELA